jgi:WD40 repeat protein
MVSAVPLCSHETTLGLEVSRRCVVYNVCFSRDGRLFATAGKDGLVRICDSRTFDIRRTLATGQGEVNAATFSPDGAALTTAGDDGTVRVWDVTTGLEQLKIDAFKKQAYGVAFTRDGNRLITCGKIRSSACGIGTPDKQWES